MINDIADSCPARQIDKLFRRERSENFVFYIDELWNLKTHIANYTNLQMILMKSLTIYVFN